MESLRVATFNVRHCRGMDGRVDIGRVAEVIRSFEADVVAVQELDVNLARSEMNDQPAELSRLTDLSFSFHASIDREEGRYGLALATRAPTEVTAVPLPGAAGAEPRLVLLARYARFTILATHLALQRRVRSAQIAAVARFVSEVEPPVVLLGDLNTSGWALRALDRVGLAGPAHRTFPAHRARRRLDHVRAGRGAQVTQSAALATTASDHLPVVATITRTR